jgi:hypothetical protein
MAEESPDLRERLETTLLGRSQMTVCRRLHLVSVLLVVVTVLGLATATLLAMDLSAEGLDHLLGERNADLMGQVRQGDGRLVQGATVTYIEGDTSSVTGIAGYYFLEDLRTGTVRIRMEADGYVTVIKTVHLERGNHVLDFYAEKVDGTVEEEGDPLAQPADALPGRLLLVIGIATCSVVALLGAMASYLHRWYPLVVMGCILGILSWGWFVGSALSVVSLLIVLPLRVEFGRNANVSEVPWNEPPPPPIESSEDEVMEVAPVSGPDVRAGGPGGMPPGS